ncbi:head maturation protease, ClpP-related [Castellaniella sp. UC4442_H9]
MKIPKLLQLARDNAAGSKPMRCESSNSEATIYLHGVIGGWWGDIDEVQFAQTMAGLDVETIHLRINSPGGDVFAGRAMMTAIAQHKARVVGHVDGLAASAASGLCMACDEVEMSQGSQMMIHEGWTVTIGNKRDHGKAADLLQQIDTALVNDYARRTGKSAAEIDSMLEAETWMSADEAVAQGFADRSVDVVEERTQNAWNLAAYKNPPKGLIENARPKAAVDLAAHRNELERRFSLLERAPA